MIGIPIDKPPRSLKDFWILQRCFNFESIDIDSPDPLDHVKILRMPERLVAISSASNSALVIEADSVDHQSITLPTTNRITQPADTGLMSGIQWNRPKQVHVLVVNHDVFGILDDLERIRTDARRHRTDHTITDNRVRVCHDPV